MMDILQTVIIGLGTLSFIVMVHEFGHYAVARACGVSVLRFSIGFGSPFLRWTDKSGTEFALAPIPLGGYVQMYGESPSHEGDPAMKKHAFNLKPVWQRSAIVVAGPAINYLLAIALYWTLFIGGEAVPAALIADIAPDTPAAYSDLRAGHEIVSVDGFAVSHMKDVQMRLLKRIADDGEIVLGYRLPGESAVLHTRIAVDNFLENGGENSPVAQLGIIPRPVYLPHISDVISGGAAEKANLQKGDLLLAADGKRLHAWSDWVRHIRAHPDANQTLQVLRDGAKLDLPVRFDSVRDDQETRYGQLGVRTDNSMIDDEVLRRIHYSSWGALVASLNQVWDMSMLTLRALAKMVMGALSPKELSGPISIVKITGEAANASWSHFISLMALISLSLGLLNLLPIPMLDGGQLLYLSIEGLFRRPLPATVQLAGQVCGAVLLGTLMIFVIYNDIIRL